MQTSFDCLPIRPDAALADWQKGFNQADIATGFVAGSHSLKARINSSAGIQLLALPESVT